MQQIRNVSSIVDNFIERIGFKGFSGKENVSVSNNKGENKFQKYHRIKEELSANYKGHPLDRIIALDLIVQVYVTRYHTLKSYLKHLYFRIFIYFVSSLDMKELDIIEPSKTLFSMGIYKRKDYYEIWKFARSNVKPHITFDFSAQKRKFKLSFRNIVKAFAIMRRSKELNSFDKLNLAAKLTYYLNIIDEVEKIGPVVSKYCSFSSVHEHEAILTSYFQKKGIPTYSLQHGLYTVFDKQIPLDAILYENFNTDFHLAWGKSTKDKFVNYGIDEESIVVAGYPRNVNRPPVPDSLNKKECLVLLARYSYHDTNLRLLKILKEFEKENDIKINLKLHPSLRWNQYKEITQEMGWELVPERTTLTELFQDSKFGWSIAVNTGSYYEAYIYNLPCLRYNDGTFEDTVDVMDDKFKNRPELEQCFNAIPFDDPSALSKYFEEVNKRLDYAIGINTNNYSLLNPTRYFA